MPDVVRIGVIADMLGLSVSRVRQLADEGMLPFARTEGGHRVFDRDEIERMLVTLPVSRGAAREVGTGPPDLDRSYPLRGLEEHIVWREEAGELGLRAETPAVHIMEYAFEEMLNNAIEHSSGTAARVRWWRSAGRLAFELADDGIGALERVRDTHGLPDELAAIQELSKGKRTSDPARHTGEGIFFTSKAVDRFTLTANGWQWVVDNVVGDQAVEVSPGTVGTTVSCRIDPTRERTMTEVFAAYATADGGFDRSRPSVKLLTYGTSLVSRSEARRLLAGLEKFAVVDLDFSGVTSVGQGFVDEVFRVWADEHPQTRLEAIRMGPAVDFMVRRGLSGS